MKKICLGIETSGTHLGLALHDLSHAGTPCIARHFEPAGGQQAEQLFPTLDRLMKRAKVARNDLAAIAVNHGPGSFTGVRIGVSAARALSQSLRIPVAGVSGLEAMAFAANPPDEGAVVVARIPAVAGEAYHAAYRNGKSVSRPAWTRDEVLDGIIRKFSRHPLAMVIVERPGSDNLSPPEGAAVSRIPAPDPSAIVDVAISRYGRRWPLSRFGVDGVAPMYLQPSWAERTAAKRKR